MCVCRCTPVHVAFITSHKSLFPSDQQWSNISWNEGSTTVAEIREDGMTIYIYGSFPKVRGIMPCVSIGFLTNCSLFSNPKLEQSLRSVWPTITLNPGGSSSRMGNILPQTFSIWIVCCRFRNKSWKCSISTLPQQLRPSLHDPMEDPDQMLFDLIYTSHCNLPIEVEMSGDPQFALFCFKILFSVEQISLVEGVPASE